MTAETKKIMGLSLDVCHLQSYSDVGSITTLTLPLNHCNSLELRAPNNSTVSRHQMPQKSVFISHFEAMPTTAGRGLQSLAPPEVTCEVDGDVGFVDHRLCHPHDHCPQTDASPRAQHQLLVGGLQKVGKASGLQVLGSQ